MVEENKSPKTENSINQEVIITNNQAQMKIWISMDYYKRMLAFKEKHKVDNLAYILDIALTQLLEQEASPNVEILVRKNGTVQIIQNGVSL